VEAGDVERRRLERNLHDGAQQRLVALSLSLGLMEKRIADDPTSAGTLLAEAKAELRQGLEELRELARGIHPAVLTQQGLAAAVEGLAARSPIPVSVDIRLDRRSPDVVEVAAYFVISEALANVAKYACAESATVKVVRHDGTLVVDINDDGIGGADMSAGSGLQGLRDRVEWARRPAACVESAW
jgi:signal transduction histidine kinase